MKITFKRYAWLKLVEGILLALTGLLIAILGGIDPIEYKAGLSVSIAVFLFLDGLLMFITAIADKKAKFSVNIITGALFISIGVILITSRIDLNAFLLYFVASVLLAIGAGEIGKGIVQIVQKEKIIWPIINFLIAVVAITLGVLSLVFGDDVALNIIYIILGVAVVVIATAEIVLAVHTQIEKRREAVGQNFEPEKTVVVEAEIVKKSTDKGKPKQIATKKTKKPKKTDSPSEEE